MSQKRQRSRDELIAAVTEREAQREAAEEADGAAAESEEVAAVDESPPSGNAPPEAPASPTTPSPASPQPAGPEDEFTGHPTGVDRPSADEGRDYHLSQPTAPAVGDTAEPQPDWRILLHIPYISPYLNETYCYLVPRDPHTLYAIWEVGEKMRQQLREKFGDDFFAKNRLIMRVYQVTGIDFNGFNANSVFEIDDWLADKNDYWIKVAPDNDYVAEIGYRAHGTTFFEKVARSNTVFAPKGRRETSERYAAWGTVEVADPAGEVPLPAAQWRFNQYYYWKKRTHHAPEEKGCWALVLHQHLPFVKHPEYNVSLEEQWFCEAVLSVYTQLLHLFWRLERDKIDFRITLSLTPTLLSMMQDPLLKLRAARHIDECIALATKERDNNRNKPWYPTIEQILHRFWCAKTVWEAYEGDLTRGYRDFQNIGKIEIITCPATHMILPLYKHFPEAVRAQIQLACRQYESVFGRRPRGMWLPENAFTPGIDRFLADEGIRWTLASANSLCEGDTRCFFGTYAPAISPAGVAFFGIDEDTRAQVWSRESGYPGHPNYKEWYRDLGYDADWDYLPPYFKTANVRRNTGIKYFRVTRKGCDLGQKEFYNPLWAEGTVHEQAGQFVYYRGAQVNYARERMAGRKPCIVSAYDAELFGHWWEEGPVWLESVFRKMLYDQVEVRPVTPSEYLAAYPHHQRLIPGAASWGKKNYFQTWVDGRAYQPNCWVYRHCFQICNKLIDLATRFRDTADDLIRRALNQAVRETFLAISSDWGFLIETGQAVRYSELRIIKHVDRARELMRQVEAGRINAGYLVTLEQADAIFGGPEMDFRLIARS